jgi:hypothetical protein
MIKHANKNKHALNGATPNLFAKKFIPVDRTPIGAETPRIVHPFARANLKMGHLVALR